MLKATQLSRYKQRPSLLGWSVRLNIRMVRAHGCILIQDACVPAESPWSLALQGGEFMYPDKAGATMPTSHSSEVPLCTRSASTEQG